MDNIKIRRRHLPHWEKIDAVYFITFNIWEGEFSSVEKSIILEHIINGNNKFYQLFAAIIMPDHVHLILSPLKEYDLTRILKGIKGVTANKINSKRGTRGRIWQDEYFDRIIRDEKEFDEKIRYMHENPIRKGLINNGKQYEFWYINE